MRRKSRQKASDFVQSDLKKKVDKLMMNRRKILAPFPVGAEEIYRCMWTEEELRALQVLGERRGPVFNTTDYCYVDLDEHYRMSERIFNSITIQFESALPCDSHFYHLKLDELPDRLQEAIHQWMPLWVQYDTERLAILNRVEKVGAVCSTYGQVMRLWPDLEGFFGDVGQAAVNSAKVASRYPDNACLWQWNEKLQRNVMMGLKSDFDPGVFAVFSNMIAECLMLPMLETKEVGVMSGYG